MSTFENRLREDLSALADVLTEGHATDMAPSVDAVVQAQVVDVPARPDRQRQRWPAVAAALVVAIGLGGGLVLGIRSGGTEVATRADGPGPTPVDISDGFGTWSPIADAPIAGRPYAVTAWTGTEAVFWAGSRLDRRFVYTDGAAYDPASDSWRNMAVPGWGHPGLTSAYFDGQLYALAKGGGTKFDPTTGIWTNLPQVEGMFLAATVATDEAIWGLGPPVLNPEGQPDLAIARYEPDSNSWIYGPVYEGTAEQGAIIQGLVGLEVPVLWSGSEIIIWGGTAGGLAFDPATETWRPLSVPEPTSGSLRDSTAIMTDVGLVVVVDQGDSLVSVATLVDDGWRWLEAEIPITDFDTVAVAAASEWIVIFSADQAPVTVHIRSGAWSRQEDGPLAGLEAPNTVWTGESLVVWGGVAAATTSNPAPVDGAIWTAPGR